jgi:broad specificity phosphatase PhoE
VQQKRGRIVLVRHGETEANRLRCFGEDDVSLTDVGRAQALELAQRLAREFRPDYLLTSEFLRARQTCEILASVLNLHPEAVPGLHERDFGCLRGQPYHRLGELMSLGGLPAEPWLWRPPGGESLDDVRLRAVAAIESLRRRYPDMELVIVCHGAVMLAVCAHITGEWSEAAVPQNCGIVLLSWDAGGWQPPVTPDCWESLAPR